MTSVSGERLYEKLRGQLRNRQILSAIRAVPREQFLDASMLPYAGDDSALPIGYEQTTSAPLVIARMIEMMLDNRKMPLKVLEIGSGCGYQTALLAEAGCAVTGIERVAPLAKSAQRRLQKMGYNSAVVRHADGLDGDAAGAPYDGIIVCAEHAKIPARLPEQLSEAGRLVLPLRGEDDTRLTAVNAAGEIVATRDRVRFVRIVRGVT